MPTLGQCSLRKKEFSGIVMLEPGRLGILAAWPAAEDILIHGVHLSVIPILALKRQYSLLF